MNSRKQFFIQTISQLAFPNPHNDHCVILLIAAALAVEGQDWQLKCRQSESLEAS